MKPGGENDLLSFFLFCYMHQMLDLFIFSRCNATENNLFSPQTPFPGFVKILINDSVDQNCCAGMYSM